MPHSAGGRRRLEWSGGDQRTVVDRCPVEYEGSARQSTTVTVGTLTPVVTIQASPSSVSSGESSTLTWSAQNATACVAS